MPKGYLIARIDVTDPERYAKYTAVDARTSPPGFGGRFIVRGGRYEAKEGRPAPATPSSSSPTSPARSRSTTTPTTGRCCRTPSPGRSARSSSSRAPTASDALEQEEDGDARRTGGDGDRAGRLCEYTRRRDDGCDLSDGALDDAAFVIATAPAAGARVSSGFPVSGCSRTFESTVVWRLHARNGDLLAQGNTTGGGVDGPGRFAFFGALHRG